VSRYHEWRTGVHRRIPCRNIRGALLLDVSIHEDETCFRSVGKHVDGEHSGARQLKLNYIPSSHNFPLLHLLHHKMQSRANLRSLIPKRPSRDFLQPALKHCYHQNTKLAQSSVLGCVRMPILIIVFRNGVTPVPETALPSRTHCNFLPSKAKACSGPRLSRICDGRPHSNHESLRSTCSSRYCQYRTVLRKGR
jgi:hypothetical protein